MDETVPTVWRTPAMFETSWMASPLNSSASGGEPPRQPLNCVTTIQFCVSMAKSVGTKNDQPYQRSEPTGSGHWLASVVGGTRWRA